MPSVQKSGGRQTQELLRRAFASVHPGIERSPSLCAGVRKKSPSPRPIHWILARFAGQVITFPLGDVVSGGTTYGHRFLSPGPLEVTDAASSVAGLQDAYVIVDPATRRTRLEADLQEAAAGVGGEVVPNPGLLEENIFLVEFPSVVCGHFEEKNLLIPTKCSSPPCGSTSAIFLRGAGRRQAPAAFF